MHFSFRASIVPRAQIGHNLWKVSGGKTISSVKPTSLVTFVEVQSHLIKKKKKRFPKLETLVTLLRTCPRGTAKPVGGRRVFTCCLGRALEGGDRCLFKNSGLFLAPRESWSLPWSLVLDGAHGEE